MIDFHSHILPSFDDGAQDVDTAIAMLKKSKAAGVDTVVSTSHCYPFSSKDINDFIVNRNEAYMKLVNAARDRAEELPDIRLGAEVHMTCDVAAMRDINSLCIEGTSYLLLEMPSSPWTESIVESVYKLSTKRITPIIAHMERNMHQRSELLDSLYGLDILVQVNAEGFIDRHHKRDVNSLMNSALVHIIGTDMHNMTFRPPCLDKAQAVVRKRYGDECWEYLMRNAQTVLDGKKISYRDLRSFKKRGLFS